MSVVVVDQLPLAANNKCSCISNASFFKEYFWLLRAGYSAPVVFNLMSSILCLVWIFTKTFLCFIVTPHKLADAPRSTAYQADVFTFERFDDLQAVRQVGPGSSRGATGVPRAAVGVVGACRCCWAGSQAVIWRQEATGALTLIAVCGQGMEFTLALHVEERPLRRVVLLAGWQAAQGSFEVLASWRSWLAQTLWATNTMVNRQDNVLTASLPTNFKWVNN